jgi:hypothetical protein
MMFGTALPILYPIALLSFVITYVAERLQAFYFNRQPPSFDHKITLSALKILPFAALINMMMTVWFMGNRQIFDNVVFPLQTVNDPITSGHTLNYNLFSSDFGLSFPALIMFWVFLLFVPLAVITLFVIEKYAPQILASRKTHEEGLINYFSALDDSDRNHVLKEESYYRERYVKT